MIFLNIHYQYLSISLGILAVAGFLFYIIYQRNRNFNISALATMRNYKDYSFIWYAKIILLAFCFLLILFSFLRPAWGLKTTKSEARGSDIVFTLDVSQSMRAVDLSQNGKNIDRLTLSKAMITDFVSNNTNNRYGLVIFAGEAFVSTPLTIDYKAFLTFLDGVDYNDVAKQGTDIAEALKASVDRFYSEQDKERGRSIIFISDGGEDFSEDMTEFGRVTEEMNIRVFTIGIGDTKGVKIPLGSDPFGRVTYKRYKGEIVETKLNEKPLKEIASITGGQYFHAKKSDDLEKISRELEDVETSVIEINEESSHEDKYQIFMLIALVLFLLFLLLSEKNIYVDPNKLKEKIKKISRLSVLLMVVLSLSSCKGELGFRYFNTKGNQDFSKQYYKDAEDNYKKASEASFDSKYISENNQAVLEFTRSDYESALEGLERNIDIYCSSEAKEHCDELYYNLGNTLYRLGEAVDNADQQESWNKAIGAYESDLEINPSDTQAEENIEFIKNKLKEAEQKNSTDGQKGQKGQEGEKSNGESGEGQSAENQSGSEDQKEGKSEEKGEGQSAESQSRNEGQKEGGADEKGEGSQPQGSGEGAQPGEKGEGAKSSEPSDAIDGKTDQELDQYLERLEQQEKNNQDYFRPNPDASKQNNSMNDFFSDPFFQNFFGGSASNFNNQENTNEVDW